MIDLEARPNLEISRTTETDEVDEPAFKQVGKAPFHCLQLAD